MKRRFPIIKFDLREGEILTKEFGGEASLGKIHGSYARMVVCCNNAAMMHTESLFFSYGTFHLAVKYVANLSNVHPPGSASTAARSERKRKSLKRGIAVRHKSE